MFIGTAMKLSTIFLCTILILSLLPMVALAQKNFIILHNGNMRSVYDEIKKPVGTPGAFSRMHAMIEKRRGDPSTKVFYFNSGNAFADGFFTKALGSNIFADVINMLTPDALGLGLRAFSTSTEQLQSFIKSISQPIVCCNVNFTSDLKVDKYITLSMGSVKMIVVGYVSTNVNHFQSPFKATNPVIAIRETIKNLNPANTLIVVLGSSDIETERKIANEVSGVNIIIGDSDMNVNKEYPIIVKKGSKKVFIIRSHGGSDTVGYFKATLNDKNDISSWTGEVTNLANESPGSKQATDMLLKFRSNLVNYDAELIAKSRVNLSAECSISECNLGNLVSDAFVDYMANKYTGPFWTDTPIGMVNSGSIRRGIDIDQRNGEITRADVLSILPFSHYLVSFTIPGEEIYHVLEEGMRNATEDNDSGFIQVSGLHVICNMSMTSGDRVQMVKARCGECVVPSYELVDSEQFYRIITNDFLVKDDNYAEFKIKSSDVVYENVTDVDVVLAYIQRNRIVNSEVGERVGTITFLSGSYVLANQILVLVCFGVVFVYFYK